MQISRRYAPLSDGSLPSLEDSDTLDAQPEWRMVMDGNGGKVKIATGGKDIPIRGPPYT